MYPFDIKIRVCLKSPSHRSAHLRFRGARGQDDAVATGRRVTPQTIVVIVRDRTLK